MAELLITGAAVLLWSSRLVCPRCKASFDAKEEKVCRECGFKPKDAHDFRVGDAQVFSDMQVPQFIDVEFNIVSRLSAIDTTPPLITYNGPPAQRDSRELMSIIKQRLTTPGLVLDLGCGPRDQAAPVEYMGHRYIGIDYSNRAADFLADAHAIPFLSETFDCVLSYAVLEHLHNPHIAIREVKRVLKPGGIYIGTVSQGEPFHQSFFHMTAWGLLALIHSVPGMRVERLWATGDTLASLSRMGSYPRVIRWGLKILDGLHSAAPWLAPCKMRLSQKEKEIDRLNRAGSIAFLIVKEQKVGKSAVDSERH